jgi:hypothetical protein
VNIPREELRLLAKQELEASARCTDKKDWQGVVHFLDLAAYHYCCIGATGMASMLDKQIERAEECVRKERRRLLAK